MSRNQLPHALALALAITALVPARSASADGGGHGHDDGDHGRGDEICLPDGVPAALTVPTADPIASVALGVGVQIYDCRVSATAPTGYAWVFRAPVATLYAIDTCDDCDHDHADDDHDDDHDDDDHDDHDDDDVVGSHYVGPTWESSLGGTVVGAVIANVPSADPTAVPWLLLAAVSHTGAGPFSDVSYIQRLSTVGGKAPATGCDATAVGAVSEVPYQATYYFYAPE